MDHNISVVAPPHPLAENPAPGPDHVVAAVPPAVEAMAPPAAADGAAAPPGAAAEARANAFLARLTRDLTVADACAFATAFVRELAEVGGGKLPLALVHGLLGRLRDRLKACKYTAQPRAYYVGLYKEATGSPEIGDDGRPAEAAYRAVVPGPASADDAEPVGMYRLGQGHGGDVRLSNFVILFDDDVTVLEEAGSVRTFSGQLLAMNCDTRLKITAGDYASDKELEAAVYRAAGPNAQIFQRTRELRNAISGISNPRIRMVTADHGWSADGTAYRTPTAVVTAEGVRPTTNQDDEGGVELGGDCQVQHLGLRVLSPAPSVGRFQNQTGDGGSMAGNLSVAAGPLAATEEKTLLAAGRLTGEVKKLVRRGGIGDLNGRAGAGFDKAVSKRLHPPVSIRPQQFLEGRS